MEKNNFPKGKGADKGVEKSRITAALNHQILRTAYLPAKDRRAINSMQLYPSHEFFHGNDVLVLTLHPGGLAEVTTELCVLDHHH